MRALLDANVLLRMMLPSDNPSRSVAVLLSVGSSGAFTILTNDDVLDEARRKATTKPWIAKRLRQIDVEEFLRGLARAAERHPRILPPFPQVCRDERDDYLVAYALASQAEVLVTGDADLLVLDGRVPFRVLDPPAFLALLRERGLA